MTFAISACIHLVIFFVMFCSDGSSDKSTQNCIKASTVAIGLGLFAILSFDSPWIGFTFQDTRGLLVIPILSLIVKKGTEMNASRTICRLTHVIFIVSICRIFSSNSNFDGIQSIHGLLAFMVIINYFIARPSLFIYCTRHE